MQPDITFIDKELKKISLLVASLLLTQKDHNIPTFNKIEKDINTINNGLEGVNESITGIRKSLITLEDTTKQEVEDSLSRFEEKVQSIKDMIPTLKDGETPTDEKLVSLIKPLIPLPIKGDKGDTPVVGIDFPYPEDGATPTDEEIIDLIKPLIPPVKDGSPDTAEDIRNKLELLQGEERLDVEYIRGVEELIEEKISEIPKPKERVVGGSGVRQFTALTDTPSSYVGQAGKVATVNATETGLEFTNPSGGSSNGGIAFNFFRSTGLVIGDGFKAVIPFSGTITEWVIATKDGTAGTITLDVKKTDYSGVPTFTQIDGTDPVLLAGTEKNNSVALTGWTTAVTAGDNVEITVASVTGVVTGVYGIIKATKSS